MNQEEIELKARLRGIELAIECDAFYSEFIKNHEYASGIKSLNTKKDIATIWALSRKNSNF
jgi:hypothetical protein